MIFLYVFLLIIPSDDDFKDWSFMEIPNPLCHVSGRTNNLEQWRTTSLSHRSHLVVLFHLENSSSLTLLRGGGKLSDVIYESYWNMKHVTILTLESPVIAIFCAIWLTTSSDTEPLISSEGRNERAGLENSRWTIECWWCWDRRRCIDVAFIVKESCRIHQGLCQWWGKNRFLLRTHGKLRVNGW